MILIVIHCFTGNVPICNLQVCIVHFSVLRLFIFKCLQGKYTGLLEGTQKLESRLVMEKERVVTLHRFLSYSLQTAVYPLFSHRDKCNK